MTAKGRSRPPGHLIEVVHTGVIVSHIDKYRDQDYSYVHLDLSQSERSKAVSFAYSCVRQNTGWPAFCCWCSQCWSAIGSRFPAAASRDAWP
jgi:hypothetical protein